MSEFNKLIFAFEILSNSKFSLIEKKKALYSFNIEKVLLQLYAADYSSKERLNKKYNQYACAFDSHFSHSKEDCLNELKLYDLIHPLEDKVKKLLEPIFCNSKNIIKLMNSVEKDFFEKTLIELRKIDKYLQCGKYE